ncbi:hypothetical protein ACGFMK_45470 [Amycolatopsis sp. NPDC049252]|uniref:hypothetical protein n=1 Tax=Amycolatopsis sp. NPDC049252 TaxID=3363933 RepID=UPI0037164D09
MTRLTRVAGAVALAVAMSLGVSAGPAFGAEADPPASAPAPAGSSPPSVTEAPVPTSGETPKPAEPGPAATTTRAPAMTKAPATTEVKPSTTAVKTSPPPAPASPAVSDPASTTPASDEPPTGPPERPDLRLTLVLDQPSYRPQDPVYARVTVVNEGTGPATDVRLTDSGNLTSHSWTLSTGKNFALAPGQTAEGNTVAWVAEVTEGVVRLEAEVTATEPDADPADNSVTVTAPLVVVRGGFTGIAYGDHNRNHAMDPGEALAGLDIRAYGPGPEGAADAVTDAEGRFAFHGLLAGTWQVWTSSPDWIFDSTPVEVDGVHEPEVLVRGEYDITGWLIGAARFAAPIYAKGDTARLIVTVTNSGRGPVPGLTAYCWTSDDGQAGLGELDPSGPGATVPATSSRSFDITVPVNAEAATAGYLEAYCRIWAPRSDATVAFGATARVPGARAAKSAGYLGTPVYTCGCATRYDPVPGVKVYLRNQVSGAIVARAVTDAQGYFTVFDLPADRYDVGIVGPWQGVNGRTPTFPVRGGDDGSTAHVVAVVPGPYQPDPDLAANPRPGPGTAPPGAAAVVAQPVLAEPHGLASTGVNVGWFAVGGLLTFAAGVSLVLGSRRRAD